MRSRFAPTRCTRTAARIPTLRTIALACAVGPLLVGCGGDYGPSTPMNPSPSAVPVGSVAGTVSSAAGGAIDGASLRIVDGPNAGRTVTTDAAGRYTLTGLSLAGFTIDVEANGFEKGSRGVGLTASNPTIVANFTLQPR